MVKNILELDAEAAKDFFLESSRYCTIEFPSYINFSELLKHINNNLPKDAIEKIQKGKKNNEVQVQDLDGVNYSLITNKDGKLAWRKLEIIHPIIYVALVDLITKENNWQILLKRFEDFKKNEKFIRCCSLPIIKEDNDKGTEKGSQITNWWREFELRSLELSLEYSCFLQSDITDCYGSLYTHSIPWALHERDKAKEDRSNNLLGNQIDRIIRNTCSGQTNGIPQGSVLMDFIGELVLAYVDQIIIEKLNLEKNDQDSDFHILRYRDDYRIFSNSQIRAEEILKIVSEALFEVGMRLNTAKTRFENNIVHGSLKVDKAAALERNVDYMGKLYKSNLHKILYKIHAFGLDYPNSGSLKKILVKLYQKIEKSRLNFENKESSAALLIDIAMISPNTYPVIIAILTYLLDKEDEEISHKLWDKIIKKTTQIPNNEYLQIWLQRGMIKRDTDKYMSDKEGKICKIVRGEKVNLWKNDWLNKNIIDKYLECSKIINKDELDSAPYPIPYNEISCFFDDDYDEPKILI